MEPELELGELVARVQEHALMTAVARAAVRNDQDHLARVSIALLWESDSERWRATATAEYVGGPRCLAGAVSEGSLRGAVENLAEMLGMYGGERSVES